MFDGGGGVVMFWIEWTFGSHGCGSGTGVICASVLRNAECVTSVCEEEYSVRREELMSIRQTKRYQVIVASNKET